MQEFIEKWNGKYIDFDGAYGNQCMDLMHQYCVEVLGLTDGRILAADYAKNVYLNFDNIFGHEYFEKIANTPSGVPQEGDIILWDIGSYGHVAIFIDGDANKFNSFDQNYPTGSFCHVQNHSYSGCLGWLRFKKDKVVSVESSVFEELVRKSTICDKVAEELGQPTNETVILQDIKNLKTYEQSVIEKDKQIDDYKKQVNELEKKVAEMSTSLNDLEKKNNDLVEENKNTTQKIIDQDKTIGKYQNDITELSGEVSELKKAISNDNESGWGLVIKGIKKLLKV